MPYTHVSCIFCFRNLEHDLLLIATHYIEKDKDLRAASGIHRSESARRKRVGYFYLYVFSFQDNIVFQRRK